MSACALFETIGRLIEPVDVSHVRIVAIVGVIGFVSIELAARLDNPALVADGYHARADGFVSLTVVLGAILVAVGVRIADPIVGLGITAIILKIAWDSWRVIHASEPGESVP